MKKNYSQKFSLEKAEQDEGSSWRLVKMTKLIWPKQTFLDGRKSIIYTNLP